MSTPAPSSPELRRLDLLRAFKLRMLRPGGELRSPFTNRVATDHPTAGGWVDCPLHAEVRKEIGKEIDAVRDDGRSRVVLLSGEAGAGKTHILRHFARPEVADEHGYVFVGGSNHWAVDEFQPCLLDWMISALTDPSPTEDGHLLLDRVRAIGFRAVGQLLENRTALKRCLVRRGGILRRFLGRRASYETIETLTRAGDPAVFGHLDYRRFGDEVCTRFLAFPGNPVHRYALRVLLAYLFPDAADGGLGTRDRVLAWFRRKPDDGYWLRKLDVADDLDRRYAVADAIKLLVHLFSPGLSERLSADGAVCRPRVFLFVFDQAEGRNELFDSMDDWNHFFAHLSELYNTLPNALVLFTMTLGLRNDLHPKMERQFKDRIRKDERFVLRQPQPAEVLALYRSRLDGWLADDPITQGLYRDLGSDYLPFSAERAAEVGGTQEVRAVLEAFDREFVAAIRALVIEPEYDFEFVRAEQVAAIDSGTEHDYTAEHVDTVRKLVEPLADDLAAEYGGVHLRAVVEEPIGNLQLLRLEFADPSAPSGSVRVYITRFGRQFNSHVNSCKDLLHGKLRARYSIWMVRATPWEPDHDKPEQMFGRLHPAATEARLWAAVHLLGKRTEYEEQGTWPAARRLILDEVRKSYLGDLLAHARDRVQAVQVGNVPAEVEVS